MNQVTVEEKEGLTKTFAIVGFIVLVIFAVWLAVRIVSIIPSAFSSLASLADSVYNYNDKQELVVETSNGVLNAGESFTVTWTQMRKPGAYTFSYACTDGVSVDARNHEGEIVSLVCGSPIILGDVTSLEIMFGSEKNRFVDVPYTITYTEKDKTEITAATTANITIVNATIPARGVADVIEPITPAVVETTPVQEVATTPEVTKPTTYVPQAPITIKKEVYGIPVSNPNGTIDLQVIFLGLGTLSGKTFTPTTEISTHDMGALQFEVKNIGTKTAEDWNYTADLPADIKYTSGDQKALKPNERAVITLGFEGLTKTGKEKIEVSASTKNDISKANNSLTVFATIVK